MYRDNLLKRAVGVDHNFDSRPEVLAVQWMCARMGVELFEKAPRPHVVDASMQGRNVLMWGSHHRCLVPVCLWGTFGCLCLGHLGFVRRLSLRNGGAGRYRTGRGCCLGTASKCQQRGGAKWDSRSHSVIWYRPIGQAATRAIECCAGRTVGQQKLGSTRLRQTRPTWWRG
jgi:hypothetical protein